jgi:fructose 1,6-bisphosphate aldolase/phosphatase
VEKITLSVFKADVGGFVGHSSMHKDVVERAREVLGKAKSKGPLVDFSIAHVGDDLELIVTHEKGDNSKEIHKLAWDAFASSAEVAQKLKLHSPGQDLRADSFTGSTIRGLGPCVAEVSFRERPSEPFIVFMADKCDLGAWNLPLYKIFADPFNTPGLVIDPSMHEGFAFEVLDTVENKVVTLQCPGDIYDLVMFLGSAGRFSVKKVIRRVDGVVAAVSSTPKPPNMAGRTRGQDDPVLVVRCQNGLPSVGEVTEAFSFPHVVTGWLRSTHLGPLMPVPMKNARAVRFDGPPRVIAAGFQLCQGQLIGPLDLFDDPAFDHARKQAVEITDYLRRHGPFEPHRLPHDQMDNTPFPPLLARLEDRFVKNETDDRAAPAPEAAPAKAKPAKKKQSVSEESH